MRKFNGRNRRGAATRRRGSAYLLVVSVVAILALIGSVFLFTAVDDRRDSEARLESAPGRGVADQVLQQIQQALAEDVIGNGESWRAYVDYASADPDDLYDRYLASTERPLADGWNITAGCWPKVSAFGPFAHLPVADRDLITRMFLRNVNPAWEFIPADRVYETSFVKGYFDMAGLVSGGFSSGDWDIIERYASVDVNGSVDGIALIDTDGDGVRDALLFPTGSYSGTGKQFYAAIRVVDTSAFVNVNTAMVNAPDGITGADVNLDGWMTVGMINPLNFPLRWPSLEPGGAISLSTWPWEDVDGNGSRGSGEYYAPGFAWLDRLDDSGAFLTLEWDVISGLGVDGTGYVPDTLGRGTDGSTRYYSEYYDNVVVRFDNPASSVFLPFDFTDEIACRWLDTAQWTNRRDYEHFVDREPKDTGAAGGYIGFDGENDTHDCAVANTASLLKSSRLQRLVEDHVEYLADNNDIHGGRAYSDAYDERWLSWAYFSRYLTTYSRSRELARHRPFDLTGSTPIPGLTLAQEMAEWEPLPWKVDVNQPLTSTAEREAAFNEYRRAFAWSLGLDDRITDADDRQDIYYRACQLAVNLLDYRDKDNEITYVDLVSLNLVSNTFPLAKQIVRGVEATPVIRQIWATRGFLSTNSGSTPDQDYTLIELYNPYEFDIDLNDYILEWDTTQETLTSMVIAGDKSFVLTSDSGLNIAAGVDSAEINTIEAVDEYTLWAPAVSLDGVTSTVYPVSYIKLSDAASDAPNEIDSYTGDRAYYAQVYRDGDRFTAHIADWQGDSPLEIAPMPTGSVPSPPAPIDDFSSSASFPPSLSSSGTLSQLPVYSRGSALAQDADLVNLAELDRLFVWTHVANPPDLRQGAIDVVMNDNVSGGAHDWRERHLDAADFQDLYSSGSVLDGESRDPLPEMPSYCRLSNFFTVNSPLYDSIDNDGDGGAASPPATPGAWSPDASIMRELSVPGRININTAPVAVLTTLPWLYAGEPDLLKIAGNLVSYRDRLKAIPGVGTVVDFSGVDLNYGAVPDARETFISASSKTIRREPGFASVGEVAAIMRELYSNDTKSYLPAYTVNETGDHDASESDDGYPDDGSMDDDITKYDMRWAYLSNLLTVSSDTFCAYIWIQEGPQLYANGHPVDGQRYIAILDRTTCANPGDLPEVKAFFEVPLD